MELNNERKHYVKIDSDTERGKIYALLDEVESDEKNGIDCLLSNSGTGFELKNL